MRLILTAKPSLGRFIICATPGPLPLSRPFIPVDRLPSVIPRRHRLSRYRLCSTESQAYLSPADNFHIAGWHGVVIAATIMDYTMSISDICRRKINTMSETPYRSWRCIRSFRWCITILSFTAYWWAVIAIDGTRDADFFYEYPL